MKFIVNLLYNSLTTCYRENLYIVWYKCEMICYELHFVFWYFCS